MKFLILFGIVLCGVVISGVIVTGIYIASRLAGVLYIDTTDSRKDLLRLQLDEDIPELITKKFIVLKVDARYYPDQIASTFSKIKKGSKK